MKHNRKIRIALVLSAVFLAIVLSGTAVLEIARQSAASSLTDQQAAGRWGGESSAQLSCFFAEGAGYDPDRMLALERSIDEALTEASLAAEGSARLWYHAYSTETRMYAATTRDSATLTVTAFGGDFFYIHQPDLVSGSWLQPGGANAGYVFLDENAAWKLFGAIDVVGMPVTVGGSEYIVCGVGKVPSGTLYDEAYGEELRGYLLLDSPAAAHISEITAYEAVLPNPIDGFAEDLLTENLSVGDDAVIVENSARFSIPALWEHLKARSTMGVRTSPVTYPWWENIAVVTEYRCATLLLWEGILAGAALVLVLIWIGIAWNPAGRALKNGFIRIRDAAEDKYNALTRPKKYRDL